MLIAAIGIIAIPSIINYINNSKNEISGVTKQLIFTGAELYLDQQNVRLITNNQKYCILLQSIVDNNLLDENISDYKTGEKLDLNKYVEVTYQFDDDLKKSINNYQIVDSCSNKMIHENGDVLYFDVTKGKVCNDYHEDNSKVNYNGTISTKTTNNQNGCLKFYIFNDYETSQRLNLLLDHNTSTGVNWDNSGDNQYGPRTALEKLQEDTGSWVGTEQPTNYTDTIINKKIDYNGYKARLITASDIYNITGVNNLYFFTADGNETETCKEGDNSGCLYRWLYDRLSCDISGNCGYWAADAYLHSVEGVAFARLVRVESFNANGVTETSYRGIPVNGGGEQGHGLRPVIEIDKSNL